MADEGFLGGIGNFFQGILGRFGGGTAAQPGQALFIRDKDKLKEYLLQTAAYYNTNGNAQLATQLTTLANDPAFIEHLRKQHAAGAADGLLIVPVLNADGTPQTTGTPPQPVYSFDLNQVVRAAGTYTNTNADTQNRIREAGTNITNLSNSGGLPGGRRFNGDEPMYLWSNAAAPSTSSTAAGLINASPMLIGGVMALKAAFSGEGDFFESLLKGLFMLIIGAVVSLFMTMGNVGGMITGGADAVAVQGGSPRVTVNGPNLAMNPPGAGGPGAGPVVLTPQQEAANRLGDQLQIKTRVEGNNVIIDAPGGANALRAALRTALGPLAVAPPGGPGFSLDALGGDNNMIVMTTENAKRLAELLQNPAYAAVRTAARVSPAIPAALRTAYNESLVPRLNALLNTDGVAMQGANSIKFTTQNHAQATALLTAINARRTAQVPPLAAIPEAGHVAGNVLTVSIEEAAILADLMEHSNPVQLAQLRSAMPRLPAAPAPIAPGQQTANRLSGQLQADVRIIGANMVLAVPGGAAAAAALRTDLITQLGAAAPATLRVDGSNLIMSATDAATLATFLQNPANAAVQARTRAAIPAAMHTAYDTRLVNRLKLSLETNSVTMDGDNVKFTAANPANAAAMLAAINARRAAQVPPLAALPPAAVVGNDVKISRADAALLADMLDHSTPVQLAALRTPLPHVAATANVAVAAAAGGKIGLEWVNGGEASANGATTSGNEFAITNFTYNRANGHVTAIKVTDNDGREYQLFTRSDTPIVLTPDQLDILNNPASTAAQRNGVFTALTTAIGNRVGNDRAIAVMTVGDDGTVYPVAPAIAPPNPGGTLPAPPAVAVHDFAR